MCGEKRQDRLDYYVPQGSPPHVRGKGFFHFTHEMFEGITPACAGKSWNLEQVVYGPGDHPRVCGEKCYNGVVKIFSRGSPPRMRGKD